MNRRGFLRAALGVAVATPVLVEALSTRSIFLPPAGGWFRHGLYKGVIHENVNAGVPQFLTNYMDPKLFDVLIPPMDAREVYFLARKPEGETDAELRGRMKTSFYITETQWRA